VLDRDGTAHILEELDHTYPNGIVAEADGSIVWVESYTLKMIRRRPDGTKTIIHTFRRRSHPGRLQDRRGRQFLGDDRDLWRHRHRLARVEPLWTSWSSMLCR
jgi:hypothetical protein